MRAKQTYLNIVEHRDGAQPARVGTVQLVGAGPGDPDLITVKALRALQQADAVVYDRLANPVLLEETRADCELHYVGKRKDQHSLPQEHICRLLATLAEAGKRVVRLKGGDPFIFGRGGEEYDYLAARAVPCEIIPGITAATGCAAATRMPLTHREHAHALVLITGHRTEHGFEINWNLAMQADATVVFYMGLSRVRAITAELVRRGVPASRPFAVIAEGTCTGQQVLVSTVGEVADRLEAEPMPSPALLVMGEVVRANDYALTLARLAGEKCMEAAC